MSEFRFAVNVLPKPGILDPQGRERFLASPQVDHTKGGAAFLPVRQIAQWGHGIAVLARGLG